MINTHHFKSSSTLHLPSEFYSQDLLVIKEVKFTLRHIDIISCVVNSVADKTIAKLLSISIKTVETHKKDIRARIREKFQEDIIPFILKSGKVDVVRQHYLKLLYKSDFEQELQNISKSTREKDIACSIQVEKAYYKNYLDFLELLTGYLKLVGIKIADDSAKIDTSTVNLCILTNGNIQRGIPNLENTIFLLPSQERNLSLCDQTAEATYIDFSDLQNFFPSFVKLLVILYPGDNLDKLIYLGNENLNRKLFESSEPQPTSLKLSPLSQLEEPILKNEYVLIKNWKLITGIGAGIAVCLFAIDLIGSHFWGAKFNVPKFAVTPPIRVELTIPADNILLKRLQLIDQINARLTDKKGIKMVVLLGIGGAGKTTLAHQYVRQYSTSLVWEVNAQTKESIRSSFESLASVIISTQEDQKLLRGIQEILDINKKYQELLIFVKRKLKIYPNWTLIFDNLEMNTFLDIKDYLPQDTEVWGHGQVIITTRDSTIKNVKYISSQDVIDINMLNEEETLTLFSKIYHECNPTELDDNEKRRVREFLNNITSFPLDISTAAHYIKDTQVGFGDYLKRIKEPNEDFNLAQESLMREIGDYTQTRYQIVSTTLQEVISKNLEFENLLLIISILFNHDIPIELLQDYKGKFIVEDLLRSLRKYSLLTNEKNVNESDKSFSLHQSTQDISLYYFSRFASINKSKQIIEDFFLTLESYIEQAINSLNIPKMKIMKVHVRTILNHEQLLTPNIKSVLQSKLGVMLFLLGEENEAQRLLEVAFEKLNKNKDKLNSQLGWTLHYLGEMYRYRGEFEKARVFLNRSLNIYRNLAPKNYYKIAQNLVCLANTYWPKGDYKNGEMYLRQCIKLYQDHNILNRNTLAQCFGSLGIIYKDKGYYKKAKELFEESLKIYQENPNNYIGVNWARAYLGDTYKFLGDYGKAKVLLEKSWAEYKKYYPNDHVRIAPILIFLGDTNRIIGNLRVAEDLLKQGEEIYRKNFSETYVWTGWSMANLAVTYKDLRQYQTAKDLIEKSISVFKKHYGETHSEIDRLYIELARIYLERDDLAEAEILLQKALINFESQEYPDIYTILEDLSVIYQRKAANLRGTKDLTKIKKFSQQSLDYLLRSLTLMEQYLPQDSTHIHRVKRKIKSVDLNQGPVCTKTLFFTNFVPNVIM
ncbi:tetratricopeptide repeat protein [Candidatus Paracaedibacter symbiosus]|uniref:tetratricopeptide repeat protein n=1 Tax=Candidatus Paracaedibacter symbiosus TaxID=244582 RepID=UPI0005094762|nr:tetratricopeptide repeat protein [Candidatus Paracaedibacter symbiosus]